MLRLTNSATSGTKPALFITTAVHAREYVTAEFGTRFAERLVDAYETDADVRWLLDHQQVHVMLHANPDGRKRAEAGLLWRKNHNANHCPDRTPGVDLNRNFNFEFGHPGGSSNSACSQFYRGTAAASESETQAMSSYMDALFPDARGPEDDDAAPSGTSGIFLDIHSHGRLVLWPWGHVKEAAPNGTALQTLGRKLAFFNGHMPLQAIGLYPASGTTQDYAYGALGRASFTYELGTTFFQSCSDFEESILDGNLESLLYAFKVARAPYVIPAGPDVLAVSVGGSASTAGVTAGTTVSLSATFDDTRYSTRNGTESSQAIAAGQYYVDIPPWGKGATAVAMSASDGTFDSTSEKAIASIDTTGWGAGRHTVFVRAKDADDNWGALGAAFLFVDTAPPATPAPPTLDAGVEQLTAAWTAPANNGSPVNGYRLRYKPTGQHFGWSVVDPGTSLQFTIEDLPNEEIGVQIRALNVVGGSAWSAPATATPDPNRPPETVGVPAELSLGLASGAVVLDVSDRFSDPDGDPLTYRASSSAPAVVGVSVAGSLATLVPLAAGTAVVTVTATDLSGSNTSVTQTFVVTVPNRPPCAFAVTPLHRDVLWTAGAEQVMVTTAPGCAWTAASESAFLAVTAGATGTGSGTVRYTVAANAGGPRTGALAVAGRRVTVYQASATQFTDHPIERGVTPVRAIHFQELRARIDALRAGAGRPAFGWTDPVPTPGVTPIRRVHLTELRAALSAAYSAAGRAVPTYTDPVVTARATVITAAHLMELRGGRGGAGMRESEGHPSFRVPPRSASTAGSTSV